MPPFLGHQCLNSFHDKTTFPGVKTIPTCCVYADLLFFFEKLKERIPDDLFDILVLTRYKNVWKTMLLQSSSSEISEWLCPVL